MNSPGIREEKGIIMSALLLFSLPLPAIIGIIVAVILIAAIIVLYFLGKRMKKKQEEQEQYLTSNKQTVSMLIIDKKKVRFKDAGFPQSVIDQAPKISRSMKVPVVKAKVGPQIVSGM